MIRAYLILSILLFYSTLGKAQVSYVAHYSYSDGPKVSKTIVDSQTNNYYVLDSQHIYITAFNKDGIKLWQTDPWKDNGIEEYRTKRPLIVWFQFGLSHREYDQRYKGHKVIHISYSNSQFGELDLANGHYYFAGQD